MSEVITTGNHPKALWPGVHKFWGQEYDEHPMECLELYDWRGSTKHREELVERTGTGLAPVKGQGQTTAYDSTKQGVVNTATHVEYGLGGVITRPALDDGQYKSEAERLAQDIGFSMRQTKEQVSAQMYNRATSASFTFGDGVALLSTAHPTRNGNQSNRMDTDAELSEAALEDLCIQIGQATNARGLKIHIMPQKLIVPVNLCFEAERILYSLNRVDSANNDLNALRSKGAIPGGYVVNHFLADTKMFYIRTNAKDGMVGFDRIKAEFTQDNDFDTDNAKMKGYMRFSVTSGDFRGIYGSDPV